MKKINKFFVLCIMVPLLLCACSPSAPVSTTAAPQVTTSPETTATPETTAVMEETTAPTEPDMEPIGLFGNALFSPEELMCFPGLSWDMTWEEVVAALGLAAEDYPRPVRFNPPALILENLPFFGVTAEQAIFYFSSDWRPPYDQQIYALEYVQIVYPDDADMELVRRELEQIYGAPDEYFGTSNDPSVYGQVLEKYQETGFPLVKHQTDAHNAWWVSDVTLADYATEAGLAWFLKEQVYPDYPKDVAEARFRTEPAAYIYWTDSHDTNSQTQLVNCRNYVLFTENETQALTHHLATVAEPGEEPFPQTDLMCLPGLEWGMSKEDTVKALGVTADDLEGGGYTYWLSDVDVLGARADRVLLGFNGGPARLSRIAVYFPDDTDMEAVKQQLNSRYGEPAEKLTVLSVNGITYNSANETLEEHLENLPESTPSNVWEADGHNLFWVSDQMIADLFEESRLEDWITQYPEIYQPYFREYAQKQVSGFVYLSDNYGNDLFSSKEYRNLLLFDGDAFASTAQGLRNIWRK